MILLETSWWNDEANEQAKKWGGAVSRAVLGGLAFKKVRDSRGRAETFVQFWWANSVELLR